jgi:hypothetical protein
MWHEIMTPQNKNCTDNIAFTSHSIHTRNVGEYVYSCIIYIFEFSARAAVLNVQLSEKINPPQFIMWPVLMPTVILRISNAGVTEGFTN